MRAIELLGIVWLGAGPIVLDIRNESRVNDMDDDPDTLVLQWQPPDMLGSPGIKVHFTSGAIAGCTFPAEPEGGGSDPASDAERSDPAIPLGIASTWAAMLVNPGVVTLHGPELFGSLVSGFGMLASNGALDCSTAQCSSIVIRDAEPDLLVAELELVADGPVVVGNDLGSMTLEHVHIELRAPVTGLSSSTGDHVIGSGNAQFVVIGEADGNPRRIDATNSTRIGLLRAGDGWQTSSFDITIIDQQGHRWIVNIPAGSWR